MKGMSRLTAIMAALGVPFTDLSSASNARVPYPYGMGEKHTRVGLSPHYRKKGPGRRHTQGNGHWQRTRQRKLATCRGNAKA